MNQLTFVFVATLAIGVIVSKFGCVEMHVKMCAIVCDQDDRELDSVKPGFRTECGCGAKKVHIYDKMRKP